MLGAAYIALGLGLSSLFVRETRGHAQHEAEDHPGPQERLSLRKVLTHTALEDRRLLAVNQAGLVNNLNDGPVGVLTAASGLVAYRLLVETYPAQDRPPVCTTSAHDLRDSLTPLDLR